MSSIRWSEEETKTLIELYKAYPYLWDCSHKNYKKPQMRTYAYNEMLSTLSKPGLTIRDIRCKIKNLRSAYYQELKKKYHAQCHGIRHISGLKWFDAFHDIMEIIQGNKTLSPTVTEEVEDDEGDKEEEISDGEGIEMIETVESAKLIPQGDKLVFSIKQEFLDDMENKDMRFCPTIGEYLDPIETGKFACEITRKKRKATKTSKKVTKEHDSDEFQLFANNMAMQLRNMPLDKALNLQVEVQALIAKERIEGFNKDDEVDHEDTIE